MNIISFWETGFLGGPRLLAFNFQYTSFWFQCGILHFGVVTSSLSLSLFLQVNGSILHNLIVYSSNQPNAGYTLNHVTSQVLYKVIHYFMENPINEKTVLRYAVPDRNVSLERCHSMLKITLLKPLKNWGTILGIVLTSCCIALSIITSCWHFWGASCITSSAKL